MGLYDSAVYDTALYDINASTQYYVKINNTINERIYSASAKKHKTNRSGKFNITLSDPTNDVYNSTTSGDEVEFFRTSDNTKLFGGFVEKIERDKDKKYKVKLTGGDYTTKLNQSLVRNITYTNREHSVIIRDLMNRYIMSTTLINKCEETTNWSVSGTFSNLTVDDSYFDDEKHWARLGSGCLKVDCGSTGTGEIILTESTGRNIASTDYICMYVYLSDIEKFGSNINLHFGTDASNYYTISKDVSSLENGWNYLEFDVATSGAGAGSPNLTSVSWWNLSIDTTTDSSGENIRIDDLRRTPHTSSDYTLSNVETTTDYVSIEFKNTTVFVSSKEICKLKDGSKDFYVDINKVMNYGEYGEISSGITLEKGVNLKKSNFWDDDKKLINKITVYGGSQEFSDEVERSGDGSTQEFEVEYTPVDAYVTVGGVTQKGYVKGMNKGEFDYKINGDEKKIVFEDGSIPTSGTDNIVIRYTYNVPIIATKKDDDSIDEYGLREYKIENPRIKDKESARLIAKDMIANWKDPVVVGKGFITIQPELDIGETVNVIDPQYFSSTEVFSVDSIETVFIGGKLSTVVGLSEDRQTVEEYISDLYERVNALEEKKRSSSDILSGIIEEGDIHTTTDNPTDNLVIKVRSVSSNTLIWDNTALGYWDEQKWAANAGIWGNANEGVWGEAVWNIEYFQSFILGHATSGVIGVSTLGDERSSWSENLVSNPSD